MPDRKDSNKKLYKDRCLLALSGAWVVRVTPVQRSGWLERAVRYYRQNFIDDVQRVAPIQLQASVEPAPKGYVDSGAWDYPAVQRLLALLGASDAAAPVRRTLRRALRPSRRYITLDETFKLFPSIGKEHPNEIYYDFKSDEYYEAEEEGEAADESVVVLRNPVEARLPSAHISIKLLREILEARALAARRMPSTSPSTIGWIPMNKSEAAAGGAATTPGGNSTDTGTGDGDATSGGTGVTGATAAGEGGEPAAEGEGGAAEPEAEAEPGRRRVSRRPSAPSAKSNNDGQQTSSRTGYGVSNVPWWKL